MRFSLFFAVAFLMMLPLACQAKSPAAVLQEFYRQQTREEFMMDPLILAGDDVVPLVIREIQDRKMPRRRYAIGFLGNGSYRQALPVLKQILQDPSEAAYVRGDALRAIYQIDASLGMKYAQQYEQSQDTLAITARMILEGVAQPQRRIRVCQALGCVVEPQK